MILFIILILILIILLTVAILGISAIGSAAIIIFGDAIVCIIFIVLIIKWLISRKK